MAMLVSSLVDEVTEVFRSYVRQQEPTTALTTTVNSSVTTLTVDDGTVVSKGLAQLEDEMIYVRSVDRTTNIVTLEPWGRGQSGSTAASHTSGSRFTQAPATPRVRARDVLSQVLQEIFPRLFPVAATTLDINGAQLLYSLPATAYHVLAVEFQPPGASLSWIPVKRWRQNKTPTAVEIEVISPTLPGNDTVRVHYIKTPPSALTMSDDLETLGYPTSIRDVILFGALAKLAVTSEMSRVQTSAVESHARSEAVPAGSATSLSRYLYQLFQARLEDEARNLQFRYPIVSHYTR